MQQKQGVKLYVFEKKLEAGGRIVIPLPSPRVEKALVRITNWRDLMDAIVKRAKTQGVLNLPFLRARKGMASQAVYFLPDVSSFPGLTKALSKNKKPTGSKERIKYVLKFSSLDRHWAGYEDLISQAYFLEYLRQLARVEGLKEVVEVVNVVLAGEMDLEGRKITFLVTEFVNEASVEELRKAFEKVGKRKEFIEIWNKKQSYLLKRLGIKDGADDYFVKNSSYYLVEIEKLRKRQERGEDIEKEVERLLTLFENGRVVIIDPRLSRNALQGIEFKFMEI